MYVGKTRGAGLDVARPAAQGAPTMTFVPRSTPTPVPAPDTAIPSSVARRWWPPLLLFAAFFVLYLATLGEDPSPDVFSADFAAWHIAQTGDPVPDIGDYPALDHNIIRETWIVETSDGREAIGRAPGVIAAGVPAYWLIRPDHLTALPGAITAALLVAGALTLLFLGLRDRLGQRHAALAAVLLGVGTPLWSVAADGMWPHTLTTFGICGMAWAAQRERWWLVGAFGGVVLWGRLHAALICAVLGVGVALARRRPGIAVRVAIPSIAMLALMSVWTHWMYGRWDPSSGYRSGDFTGNAAGNLVDPINFLGFWIAPDRGLLWWAPLGILLLPALRRGWRDLPDWSRSLLVGGVLYLLVQGLLVRFSGGDAFYGYRTSIELVVCAAPALALTAHRMGPRARRWFAPLAFLQVAMIAPGAVIENLGQPVADVWRQHAFLTGAVHRPVVTLGWAVVAVLAAWLVWRITRPAPDGTSPRP